MIRYKDANNVLHTRAHRISYILNGGSIPSGMQILHLCDNRKCVNPEHLRCGTAKENTDNRVSKGRKSGPSSQNSHKAKLDWDTVREIRTLFNRHCVSTANLALRYNVSDNTIYSIVTNRTWHENYP